MDTVDLWDDTGAFEYRHLPESRIGDFFTEERDMLQITHERDGFWLTSSRESGATRYGALDEAKATGDEEIRQAEAARDGLLLREAGLDAATWKVTYEYGLCFEQKDGPLWIWGNADGMSTKLAWDLNEGDDSIVLKGSDLATVVAAARTREARPTTEVAAK